MIEIGLILIALALSVRLTGKIAKVRARDLELQSKMLDKLYGLCAALIDDERVGDDVARFARFLAASALRRGMAWKFVCALAFRAASQQPNSEAANILAQVNRLPDDAKEKIQQAVVYQLICLTFNHLVLGRLMRRMILWAVNTSGDAAPKIIKTMGWCGNGNEGLRHA